MQVCFLKLQSGEEIVGKVDNMAAFSEEIELSEPLRMQYVQQDPIHMTIGLTKWLPFLDQDVVNIKSSAVTVFAPAGVEMTEYYKHCLENEAQFDLAQNQKPPSPEEIESHQKRLVKIQEAREAIRLNELQSNNSFTIH